MSDQVTISDDGNTINISAPGPQGVPGPQGIVSTNPTADFMPINAGIDFVDSPLRLENGILISSVTVQSPSASLRIGPNLQLSDSGSGLGYTLRSTGSVFELSAAEYDEISGSTSELVRTFYADGAFDATTQGDDSETLTANYHQWEASILGLPANVDLLRVFTVTLRGAAGPQAPVRLRIFSEDPLLNINAIPFYTNVDDVEWQNGNEGFILVDGLETVIDFEEGQRLEVNTSFWIVYDVPVGEQFSVAGATVDIGFGLVFIPYQVSNVMAGEILNILANDDESIANNRTLSAEKIHDTFDRLDVDVVQVFSSSSVAIDQMPLGTDTPLLIEFGPAQNGPADDAMLSATGAITINTSGTYQISAIGHLGRDGTPGEAHLRFAKFINGTQSGPTIAYAIDAAKFISEAVDYSVNYYEAGDIIEYFIARDSSGQDAGGMFLQEVNIPGWNSSATATISIKRLTILQN